MPRGAAEYPTRDETIAYLAEYERRYALPVLRPVTVTAVHREAGGLRVSTTSGDVLVRCVVSATGSWSSPVIPDIPGADRFGGAVVHSASYAGPEPYAGRRVIVVGAGNSAAQILAELSAITDVTWTTLTPPRFLPDDIDGRVLFEQATARYRAIQAAEAPPPPRSLGDIVMVPSVREARDRGVLVAHPMFTAFTEHGVVWSDGRESVADAVILATGFVPALSHLAPLGVLNDEGRVALEGGRSIVEPRLWLVGYGEWTGFASATLIGVGRSARAVVEGIKGDMETVLDAARR